MKLILKSFLFSLAALIGINVIFRLIGFAIAGSFQYLLGDPFYIVVIMFEGILRNIYISIQWILQTTYDLLGAVAAGEDVFNNIAELYIGFGYLLAPIIAGILAGNFSETKLEALGGYLLAFIVCWLAWTIFYVLSIFGVPVGTAGAEYRESALLLIQTSVGPIWTIILVLIASLITPASLAIFPLVFKKEFV